jgi:hypothetical protein
MRWQDNLILSCVESDFLFHRSGKLRANVIAVEAIVARNGNMEDSFNNMSAAAVLKIFRR